MEFLRFDYIDRYNSATIIIKVNQEEYLHLTNNNVVFCLNEYFGKYSDLVGESKDFYEIELTDEKIQTLENYGLFIFDFDFVFGEEYKYENFF